MKNMTIANANEVKPRGWLRKQLEIQAEGLSGNLDKVWPDIRDSAWIGGDREGWERVPYWLDGFIPLAYLLDNDDMKKRSKKYIDAILSFQKEDGWICPCKEDEIKNYDTWALLLISKVFTIYYQTTGDERVLKALYKAMKNYYELLSDGKIKLFNWGKYRWFEGFFALRLLESEYHEKWIRELAVILQEQGADYSKSIRKWKKPKNKWKYDTHVVNIAMMLKQEAVCEGFVEISKKNRAENLFDYLYTYNGTPVGTLTGDECLSGKSPIQGTELCSVAELMFSYETLYAYSGNPIWAEMLEKAAFNAMPATVSDDMWTHQYDQMINQIACENMGKKAVFRTNSAESHLFGLEPNFGCCTANLSQAFPKLALSAFMKRDDCILNAVAIPSEYTSDGISIVLDTEYPFKNTLHYHIKSDKDFVFKVRINSFAERVMVNGIATENTGVLEFHIEAGSEKDITITFAVETSVNIFENKLVYIRRGSLVFSFPVKYSKRMHEYEKDDTERKYPYCDYEYVPESEWQYGLADFPDEVVYNGVGEIPFSSEKPPIVLKTKMKRINWGFEKGYNKVCRAKPRSMKPYGEEVMAELWPYGCAKLRITEMPFLSYKRKK